MARHHLDLARPAGPPSAERVREGYEAEELPAARAGCDGVRMAPPRAPAAPAQRETETAPARRARRAHGAPVAQPPRRLQPGSGSVRV